MDTVVRGDAKKIISYRRLKTQEHSVSIGYYCFFIDILISDLLMHFFHIPNRTMCLSKKISRQYFVIFYPAWDSFSPENILYFLT